MGDYTFEAKVWRWTARTEGWFFVALPPEDSDAIDAEVPVPAGFGSVPVEATIGLSTWKTSVFPDKDRGTFVLPLKKKVRTAERFGEGDVITVHVLVRPEAL